MAAFILQYIKSSDTKFINHRITMKTFPGVAALALERDAPP